MHECLAKGCNKQIPAQSVMCRMHWVMVPTELQQSILAAYREDSKGDEYISLLRDAVLAVKHKEDLRRRHAATERHEFREALKLLRNVNACKSVLPEELATEVADFCRRHPV